MTMMLSPEALAALPEEALREVLGLMEAQATLELREQASEHFLSFVHHVYEDFIEGAHHRIIAEKLELVAQGKIKRLIINMPPRHSKSELASYLLPSWFIGRNPKLKIIQATHNTDLAVRFGRKVRDLVAEEKYRRIFPDVHLKSDDKAAGKWSTSANGEYFAAGVGAAVTGRGADLFVIDDPHSEQDALNADVSFPAAFEWYTSGPRQRLQPGAAIIVVMTRWGKKDLTGMLLAAQANDPQADQWEVVEFPAILPSGNATWPEFWDVKELETVRANLPVAKWQAQWQQAPTSEEGSIIKREWWKEWKGKKIPACSYIMQSYDTAFSAKEKADFSAITTWGIFVPEEGGPDNIILLDARRGRWSFPELKEKAFEEHEYWDPDMVIVEAKATGQPLIDELRLGGIPAVGYSPGKGRDKVTRMHVCAPMFEAGRVWVPEGKRFAEEVIEEIASFPYGDNDDYADSTTMALMRFRQGGFVYLDGEEDDEEEDFGRKQREYY